MALERRRGGRSGDPRRPPRPGSAGASDRARGRLASSAEASEGTDDELARGSTNEDVARSARFPVGSKEHDHGVAPLEVGAPDHGNIGRRDSTTDVVMRGRSSIEERDLLGLELGEAGPGNGVHDHARRLEPRDDLGPDPDVPPRRITVEAEELVDRREDQGAGLARSTRGPTYSVVGSPLGSVAER